jgi:16S rRNA (guanine966-N2)-methyltransferase
MRVISGVARGRPLSAPPGGQTRPTTDRVREAIFSMIESEAMRRGLPPTPLPFPRVLDLYAGTGAMGIEALSRGAEAADFVEIDPRARATITRNLERTGLAGRARIHAFPAREAPSSLSSTYDLILADPPYADPETQDLVERIARSQLLAMDGILTLEYSRGFQPPEKAAALRLDRVRRYGTTYVALYMRDTELA